MFAGIGGRKGKERGMSTKIVPDENEIRVLLENWASAVRARNLNGILAHHSPEMLMFDVPPPLVSRGIEAYRKTWDAFFSWATEPVMFNFDELDVAAGNDVAFVTALMRCAGKEGNGKTMSLRFRLTVGLRKLARGWTIMHEHHSIPSE
jgi:ketosteroid isomerase-like protein